jgi:hypothetical protein
MLTDAMIDGWRRISLDDAFPIRQVLPVGLARARVLLLGTLGSVFLRKKSILVDTIHLHVSQPLKIHFN